MKRRDPTVLADMGCTWDDLVVMARTGNWPHALYRDTYETWRSDDDPPVEPAVEPEAPARPTLTVVRDLS